MIAQESSFRSFLNLSGPEKRWVVFHPFIAKKAHRVTLLAKEETKEAIPFLGNESNGGKLDAYRHSIWMALLAQKIAVKKARSLGKAHEKGNYKDYKKNRLEEGELPDEASSKMDLWNNEMGLCIGCNNKTANIPDLRVVVIEAINSGKMAIIKKDSSGNFLTEDEKVIPQETLKGKWKTPKALTRSDR